LYVRIVRPLYVRVILFKTYYFPYYPWFWWRMNAQQEADILAFRACIQSVRASWLRVPRKTKKPKGPRFMAVCVCQECGNVGMTSMGRPIAKRWNCSACGEIKLPVWADGPVPDEDEIYIEYTKHLKLDK
jgi:hypothetical protein